MKLAFTAADEQFREEVADWLNDNLRDEFADIRYRGGPGDEHRFVDERKAWERRLADGRWTCIGWPEAWGGRAASIEQQVIFYEEYARAGGPGRMGHIGDTLTGPTLLAFGSEHQKAKYLPPIRDGMAFWSQGYSEPGAGSDLAAIRTKAVQDEISGQWKITGQKVWTSLAHESDFVFVLARVDRESSRHHGLATYALFLCAIAFLVLINFNNFTILMALASMPLAFTYPLMKRITYSPQLFLGITFNYGLILAWISISNEVSIIPMIFYLGAIFWTLGYDTIYGFQDIKDDEIIGVKSTSIKFKNDPKKFLFISYSLFIISLFLVGILMKFKIYYFLFMIIPILHLLVFQVRKLNTNQSIDCFSKFKSNNFLGAIILINILIGKLI